MHGGAGWFQHKGEFPERAQHRTPARRRGRPVLPQRRTAAAALPAVLAGQPVRAHVAGAGDHRRRAAAAVADAAAAVPVPRPLADLPLVPPAARFRERRRRATRPSSATTWTSSSAASSASPCRWPTPTSCTRCASTSTWCAGGCRRRAATGAEGRHDGAGACSPSSRGPDRLALRAQRPGRRRAAGSVLPGPRIVPSRHAHPARPPTENHTMDTRTSPPDCASKRVRDAATPRPRRRARALQRPAPVGVPSGALAGPRVAVGLHRLDGHARGRRDQAALFADSRYWTQAEAELAGSGIELVKISKRHLARALAWLARVELARRSPSTGGCSDRRGAGAAQRAHAGRGGGAHRRRPVRRGLGRPPGPTGRAGLRAPAAARAGVARRQAGAGARGDGGAWRDAALVSTLDDIAWLFNPRGGDVVYNPVFLAHALIGDSRRQRCSSPKARSTAALRARLAADGVALAPYADAARARRGPPARAADRPARVARPARAGSGRRRAWSRRSTRARSPRAARATPRPPHVREAMEQDGAAMCASSTPGSTPPSRRRRAPDRDRRRRAPGRSARAPGTCAARASHHRRLQRQRRAAALPRHAGDQRGDRRQRPAADRLGRPVPGRNDRHHPRLAIGTVSDAMKRDYTLVLKGTLALSRTRFPRGTLSPMLDAIARAPLWAEGLTTATAPGTASATSSTSTRARSRSARRSPTRRWRWSRG